MFQPAAAPLLDPGNLWPAWKERVSATLDLVMDEQFALLSAESASTVLLEEVRAVVKRPAKRVRPLLLLHAYRTVSGQEPGDDLFRVAAAVEMVHAFILVHDDIIDRSDHRGGQATLHRALEGRLSIHHGRDRVARDVAIVLGDLLFVFAQRAVLRSGLPAAAKVAALDAMLAYVGDTGLGECDDILFGVWDIGRLTSGDVERMYWLKTTRYSIEGPMVLGALLGGCGPGVEAAVSEAARPLGLAFQICNDLSSFRHFEVSDASPDDFLEGKKTLLVTTAHELLGETDRRLLQLCLGQRPVSEAGLATLKELVTKSGAVSVLEARVDACVAEGRNVLRSHGLDSSVSEGLCAAMSMVATLLSCPSPVRSVSRSLTS